MRRKKISINLKKLTINRDRDRYDGCYFIAEQLFDRT